MDSAIDVVGFAPDEITLGESTRSARLKWVIVVDPGIPAGRMVNAVACVAAGMGDAVSNLIGPGGLDASGESHPGLPWSGCTILAADPATLAEIRARAVAADGVFVTDMPAIAQATRVYGDYLAQLAETKPEDLAVCAVGIIGPRNKIGKLVKRLELLP
jgi:hypothetical protein